MEKRVLIVEADGKRRGALRDALAACGLSVQESPSPSDAMGVAKADRFDGLVVTDESRALALKGLCGMVKKGCAAAQLFVVLQPQSDQHRVASAAGGDATLVPSNLSAEELASRVVSAMGSSAPEVWAYERLSTIRKSRLWEAQHAKKTGGSSVLLTRVSEQFAQDEELRAEFIEAARAAAAVRHPGLLPTVEIGGTKDIPYVATQIVPGELFSGILGRLEKRGERLPVEVAAYVAHEIAQALEAAHSASVLHGALSPETVWVANDGRVYVLYLGVAQVMSLIERNMRSPMGLAIAQPYLSPEQIQGTGSDARSDVFLAGIILHEALAGRPLFGRRDASETMRSILEGRVPELGAPVPSTLADVAMACLEKKPSFRLQTAGSMARRIVDALRAPLETEDDITEERPGFLKRMFAQREPSSRASTPAPRAIDAARDALAALVTR